MQHGVPGKASRIHTKFSLLPFFFCCRPAVRRRGLSKVPRFATMAGSSSAITLVPASQQTPESLDSEMAAFLTEVKTIFDAEKLSSSDQIARLFRPGAKYFNMNPFEVLGLSHTASVDDVRRAYRRMSVQVHPDKNPGNDLAAPAFEIIKEAHDRLDDPERFAFCARICAAAQDAVERKVAKEKKRLRKEGASEVVPEDDPATMELQIKVMISRMFAEFEQRKAQLAERDKEMQKRAKQEQAEKEFMEALQKKEQKMWEKSRQKRVNGWRAWAGGSSSKTISKIPNKVKEERRKDGTSGYNEAKDERGESYKKEWR